MLPLDLPWYRRLLGFAFAIGLGGGVLGLTYLAVTNTGIDLLFGSAGTTAWSGEWWWIPLVAFGALAVVAIREWWSIEDHVPGAIEAISSARADHKKVPGWVVLSAISVITGASLGPSFALVMMGGALGSWIAERRWAEGKTNRAYTLTGMAGGLGGAFTAPVFGAFMVSEIAPTPREGYVAAIIPQLIASTVGFAFFYLVIGRTFLGSFRLPPYDFELGHMVIAAGLGVVAAGVLFAFVAIQSLVRWVSQRVPNRYVLAGVGGAVVGLIAVALPLTLGSGNSQLSSVITDSATLGVGLLLVVLVGKMVALAISLSVGFIGGNVFPMMFLGGTAGTIVHLMFPGVPYALAVSVMLAAVPGGSLRSPMSLTLISAITVGLGATTVAPVAVAVVTSYVVVATVQYLLSNRKQSTGQPRQSTS